MKLSKTLLSALLAGISLQTLEACKKEVVNPDSKKLEAKKKSEAPEAPVSCPACGMG